MSLSLARSTGDITVCWGTELFCHLVANSSSSYSRGQVVEAESMRPGILHLKDFGSFSGAVHFVYMWLQVHTPLQSQVAEHLIIKASTVM